MFSLSHRLAATLVILSSLALFASNAKGGERILVGGDLNNGNFNAPASENNIPFWMVPGWENIGTGDQNSVALRIDESYDGTHNAVIAGQAARTHGLDTGHTIQTGDIYSLSYVWRDSFQWVEEEDQIVVRLFTTSDDTITGERSHLVSMSSGISSLSRAYEYVNQPKVYMASTADAGKRLFVALDTFTATPNTTGFARMDNFKLSVEPYGVHLQKTETDEGPAWSVQWPAVPDRHYTLLRSTDLENWSPVRSHIPAEDRTVLGHATTMTENEDRAFYKVRREVNSGLVDPETPADAQPFLVTPTGDNWVLDFSDEFNGTEVDLTKWQIDDSPRSRDPRWSRGIHQWFWRPRNVSVADGHLILDVEKTNSNTMATGAISSRPGKYETTFGFFEVRVKIADTTKDTHTAFWLQGKNMGVVTGSGNNGAEVDVFESAWFGDFTKAVVHIDGYGADRRARTRQYDTPGLHDGFNVFGLHWTPNEMRIYYNGVHKVTYTGRWLPLVPEWLWLSNGASFGDIGTFQDEPIGWLTSSKWDYVRVWKSR
ncbi:MAG: glycosyl hydrolase family protein [Puniceicoccaceae bacterium]|nr:MAG: glycosyl hydrolase family protein [Puniceicoccaceae bacterium]